MQNSPIVLTEDQPSKGRYIITLADIVTDEAKRLEARFIKAREQGKMDLANQLIRRINGKFGQVPLVIDNLIPTVGRGVFAQRLCGTLTYTGTVNYVALGTGSTAPANGDTQLTTETYRRLIFSATPVNNIAYITGVFTAAEVSGTFAEVGLFIDGTASPNSGQIYSHALAAITKSAIQTLTIDWVVTLT